MNLTNIKYLYDLIDQDKLVFFTIYDSKGSTMRDQCNDSYTVSDAKNDLEQFLEYNSGVFRVEFRRTKGNSPTTKTFAYTIDNQKEAQRETPMGNLFAGSDQSSLIASKDAEISTLRNQMLADAIANMNKLHEREMELLRKDLKSGDGDNAALMQAGITALTGMFGGGQSVGVSGIGALDVAGEVLTTNNNTMTDKNKQINASVVMLMNNDPDFAKHIHALAMLSENNIMIYKMAIQKLNDL